MKKYDRIRYITDFPEMLDLDDLICEVKYDGSNGRITVEEGVFIFGTRNLEGIEITDKNFLRFEKEIEDKIKELDAEEIVLLFELLDKFVLFFEMIGDDNLHKLHYDIKKDFIAFDGYDKSNHEYVSTENPYIDIICDLLNFKKAERLERFKTYNQAKEWLYEQDSKEIEGLVFKYYPLQLRCKALHPKNSVVESAKFKKSKKSAHGKNYYDSLFLHTYITKNRVHQIMFNLKATKMGDISIILKELWLDLIMECISPFIIKYHREADKISIAYIKKNMPKIAVSMIKEIIQDGMVI